MTDRLTTLLHDAASAVPVPSPPVDGVLARGHAIRRRRTTTVAVVAAAAAVVVVAVGLAVLGVDRADRDPEPAQLPDDAAYQQQGAWARGDELHVGNHTAVVPGLGQLSYSSAGVVARGNDGFVLVTPAGEVEPLDLDLLTGSLGVPEIATDPGTPNLGYVRTAENGRGQAMVRDLATGADTTVGTPFRSGGPGRVDWLSGDLLSYTRGQQGQTLDWRTGEPSAHPQRGWWQAAGVSVNFSEETWTLTTFGGDPLLSVPGDPASSYGSLSPDGSYFLVAGTEPGMTVYDVHTGDETAFPSRAAVGYGWTPDGHLIGASPAGGEIEICDAASGACEGTGATTDIRPLLVVGTPGTAL